MSKPRCFIAMAFERADTDALYERKIMPLLKRLGITPIIINRSESTDDLNKQIIEQLNACDFCITDLTYERPSVYFEAGYAQRAVPVIYTVRSDHVPPRRSDDGRVHFDLTMKPLIQWKSRTDKTFQRRLEKRVRFGFLHDWNRRQQASDELDKARGEFGRLSVRERLHLLRDVARNAFKRIGFGKWQYEKSREPAYDHVVFDDGTGFWVGERRHGRTLTIVKVKALDSLPKRQMVVLAPDLAWYELQVAIDHAVQGGFKPARLFVHCLIIVLRPISTVQLESVLHNLPAGERPGQYRVSMNLEDRSNNDRQSRPRVPTVATLECVAPVKSEEEFRKVLRTLVPKMVDDV
jgi:hypothetical protein